MPVEVSEYERLRQKNIADNKKVLAELGLLNPFVPLPRVIRKAVKRKPTNPTLSSQPSKKPRRDEDQCLGSVHHAHGSRRSARVQGQAAKTAIELKQEIDAEEDDSPRNRIPPGRENVFGAIPGVEVGVTFETRLESCAAGVHRPTVAGIHGGPEGAYSIALSGGYEDDIDMGECFTYTGQGGRDLKGTKANPKNLRTAPQSKDQTLTHGNLALSKNVESGRPVRVIRGYKLDSPYAPEWGYRYDGIYTIEKCWFTTGLSGFGVWKFALRRCADQAPPPWEYNDKVDMKEYETSSPDSGLLSKKDNGCETGTDVSEPDSESAKEVEKEPDDELKKGIQTVTSEDVDQGTNTKGVDEDANGECVDGASNEGVDDGARSDVMENQVGGVVMDEGVTNDNVDDHVINENVKDGDSGTVKQKTTGFTDECCEKMVEINNNEMKVDSEVKL